MKKTHTWKQVKNTHGVVESTRNGPRSDIKKYLKELQNIEILFM